MREICKIKDCCGCGTCMNVCPHQCISMKQNHEGFFYPIINKEKCVDCGLCKRKCPVINHPVSKQKVALSFAIKNNDDNVRLSSSSGGLFTALAQYILMNKGVVYGAAFSKDNKIVNHVRIDNLEEVSRLNGSKYIQSNINMIYKDVRKDLNNGKIVLFSGVPCQINGLTLFLGKEYDNLIKVEVICHGVPSQGLWEKYINDFENKNNIVVSRVNFREKRDGWKQYGLLKEGNSFSQYLKSSEDPYMIFFLKNLSLRQSCYSCRAKRYESLADLTIGDFWGIDKLIPEFDDNKGTNLVLVHTDIGADILGSIKQFCTICSTEYEKSIENNPSYYKSVQMPRERKQFYYDVESMNFDDVCKKYCIPKKTTIFRRILIKAKHLLIIKKKKSV